MTVSHNAVRTPLNLHTQVLKAPRNHEAIPHPPNERDLGEICTDREGREKGRKMSRPGSLMSEEISRRT
jgi:hypothetical protein